MARTGVLAAAASWLLLLGMMSGGAGWCRAAEADASGVDPAAKQLQATHGLFKRGLFKEAAEEYAGFLKKYGGHELAGEARYGLAIARFRLGEFAEAASVLAEVVKDQKFPQRDEALAVLGHCYLSTGEHAKALAAFDELLERHAASKHAESAAINRVQALYLADKKREALEAADAFLEKYAQGGQRGTALYFRMLAEQGLGRHEAAARTASEILRTYKGSSYEFDVRLVLGQSLEAAGKGQEAIEAYREAVKGAPAGRAAEGRYSLGAALYKSGKYEEALKEFAAVLRAGEKSNVAPAALLQLGLTQVALGQHADARTSLEAVVRGDPARAGSATYGLAQVDLAEKKYSAALGRLELLAKGNAAPVDAVRLTFDRGVALMGLEKFDEAAGEFERVGRDPRAAALAAEAAYRRGYCLHRLAKYEDSHKVLAAVPKDAAIASAAAELDAENLFLMGKYAEAQGAYGRLSGAAGAADQGRRDRLRLRLGQTAYFAGKYEEAIAQLSPLAESRTVTTDGELSPALLLLGDAMIQTGKFKEAAGVLAKYVPIAKKDAEEARFKLALAQLRGGDERGAERSLSELAGGDVSSPWVVRGLFEYGQLQFTKKRHDGAREALRKVIAAKPAEELAAPAAYMLAWIDLEAKRYDEAAKGFAAVAVDYPKHALAGSALYQQGVALREAGQDERAASVFKEYVEKWPQGEHVGGARQMIASSLTKAGKPQEAVKLLAALAKDAKTRSDAVLYELAWAQRGAGDEGAAVGSYEQLIEQFADSKLIDAARAEVGDLLYKQARHADAAKHLEKAVEASATLDPRTLAVARYRLGCAYEKQKEWRKAAAAFARFVKEHPTDELAAPALYQAGEAAIAAGRLAEAQQYLAQLVKEHANSEAAPVAMLKLGEVRSGLSDHEGAASAYRDYLTKHADGKFAYLAQFGVGWALENQKKHDEARTWYEKVTAGHNGPTAARAQFQIGETYFAEGKYAEAVKSLLAVEDVYGKTEWAPRAIYEAGRALEQLGQAEKAKEQYRGVVEKYKDAPEAALAQKALKGIGG